MLSIGLMSGTSMDGIDAALLKTDGSAKFIQNLGHVSIPYDPDFKILLKATEYAIRKYAGNLDKAKNHYKEAVQEYVSQELHLSSFNASPTLDDVIHHSTHCHLIATQKLLEVTGYNAKQIDVIGYHGQTMFHSPSTKISIVVGDGQYLAEKLGITVVNDFRSRDITAGGQGAPLAPLYHQAIAIRDQKLPLAVVNCGGIANITLIPNANELDLIGFDTGPGNGLIDRLVKQRTHGQETMDTNGQYGKKGKVNPEILKKLYEKSILKEGQNYFSKQPPKSLDIGDMELIPELNALSLEDACATLEAFTADTIIHSLDLCKIEIPINWILAGGGWNNPMIRNELETRLRKKLKNNIQVLTANEAGWNSQAMEAQIFSYLAVRSLQNKPLSMPNTTGVSTPISGGYVYIPLTGTTKAVKKLIQEGNHEIL